MFYWGPKEDCREITMKNIKRKNCVGNIEKGKDQKAEDRTPNKKIAMNEIRVLTKEKKTVKEPERQKQKQCGGKRQATLPPIHEVGHPTLALGAGPKG